LRSALNRDLESVQAQIMKRRMLKSAIRRRQSGWKTRDEDWPIRCRGDKAITRLKS